jgi:hypothetical protein
MKEQMKLFLKNQLTYLIHPMSVPLTNAIAMKPYYGYVHENPHPFYGKEKREMRPSTGITHAIHNLNLEGSLDYLPSFFSTCCVEKEQYLSLMATTSYVPSWLALMTLLFSYEISCLVSSTTLL